MGITDYFQLRRLRLLPHHGQFILLQRLDYVFAMLQLIPIFYESNFCLVHDFETVPRLSTITSYSSAASWFCGTSKVSPALMKRLEFYIFLTTDSISGMNVEGSVFQYDRICYFNIPACQLAINAFVLNEHARSSTFFVFGHRQPTFASICVSFHHFADKSSAHRLSFSDHGRSSAFNQALKALISVVARTVVI